MAHWLLKTEPATYSYADLERDGHAVWDGVSNALALKHLRAMRKGDAVLIYHTGDEKAIVGLAVVASLPYPDPKAPGQANLVVVDLKPQRRLASAVTLASVKADPAFAGFDLVRLPRLSVMPVPPELWRRLLKAAGE
jgi:predicted RNA-binding protein with PUA-like domain